jgi:DNA-binding transcriptional regulator YdaS (Cro superfamily)
MTLAEWLQARVEARAPGEPHPVTWLAERLGVHVATIAKWRAGVTLPWPDHRRAIAEATDGAVTIVGLSRAVDEYQARRRPAAPPRPPRRRTRCVRQDSDGPAERDPARLEPVAAAA